MKVTKLGINGNMHGDRKRRIPAPTGFGLTSHRELNLSVAQTAAYTACKSLRSYAGCSALSIVTLPL
jgi:hypothetical protein